MQIEAPCAVFLDGVRVCTGIENVEINGVLPVTKYDEHPSLSSTHQHENRSDNNLNIKCDICHTYCGCFCCIIDFDYSPLSHFRVPTTASEIIALSSAIPRYFLKENNNNDQTNLHSAQGAWQS